MYLKRIKFLMAFSIAVIFMYSCTSSNPEENSKSAVKKFLLDSLKNQKLEFKEFTAFDTITRYDSLLVELSKLNKDSVFGNEQLKQLYEQKKSFESISELGSMFGNADNKEKINVANENMTRSINNYKIGLALNSKNRKKVTEELKNPKSKKDVSYYSIHSKIILDKDTIDQSFILTPAFKVIK